MVHVNSRNSWVRVSPDLEIFPRKLFGHERVELKSRPQSGSNFLEVLDFQYGRRGPVQLEHLNGWLEDVLARDPDFLPLKAAQETEGIVSTRRVLSAGLLALPFEDEPSIAEGCWLEEGIACPKGKEEWEMLREIQRPLGKTRAAGNVLRLSG